MFYQKIVFGPKNQDSDGFKAITHHLYIFLMHSNTSIREKCIGIWKLLLLQKPIQVAALLKSQKVADYKELVDGFSKILELNAENFYVWFLSKQTEIASIFAENATRVWDLHCQYEWKYAKDNVKADKKSRSTKLKRQYKRLAAEHDVYTKYTAKAKSWVSDVQIIENTRFQRFKYDYAAMIQSIDVDWSFLKSELNREKAIWGADIDVDARWKLDFTEAKNRIRKKFRRNTDAIVVYASRDAKPYFPTVTVPAAEDAAAAANSLDQESPSSNLNSLREHENSFLDDIYDRNESPVNQETLAAAINDDDLLEDGNNLDMAEMDQIPNLSVDNLNENIAVDLENGWEEVQVEEDQNQKLLRLLDSGDEILDTINCGRLTGLELCEGLCIICQNNIYLIDNYFQRADSEIVDIDEATMEERNIYHFIVTQSKRSEDAKDSNRLRSADRHICRKCSFSDIQEVHKSLYLFRNVALEIFLVDGRNFLLTFWTTKARDAVYNQIYSKSDLNASESVIGVNQNAPAVLQTVLFGGSPLAELTQKWCNREITNFAYLMHLNTLAGRSYNDLTQYPVFPWILSDYESKTVSCMQFPLGLSSIFF